MPSPRERENALFRAAVVLPPGEARQVFLDQACAGDATLRACVETLLARSGQPNAIPDHAAPDTAPQGDVRPAAPAAHDGLTASVAPDAAGPPAWTGECAGAEVEALGTQISHYKLVDRVGEGGFGVVYVAEQTEPIRRRVALKVIKLGMDTRQVVARFEAERQALAMMDHPNIASVLDGGSTAAGRPYFVMELVGGIRITDFCDQNTLSTPARLNLFLQVCHAIQHAHQKGIIHRDIKPSNILVTLRDGVPVPKVIDFGIAKATAGRLTDATMCTQLNQVVGTPVYMSPEQAERSGLDVDTRSDIYSLGVLLYELLTGSTPFNAKELRSRGPEGMAKMLREREPPRPSNRLAALKGEELTTTVQRRATDAARLISLLRGDLDWIVMKCLEKDRARRYATANGLARDIERHLKHEPVLARPPSRVYRLRKSMRRHWVGYSAAAGVAVALALGIVFSTWQAVRATQAEKLASQRWVEAERARKESEAITKFLTEVFQRPNPARDGRTITVAEILDKAVTSLDRDLGDQSALRAPLKATLGHTYFALGLYRDAIPLLEEVLEHYRATCGPEHPDTLTAMHQLSTVYHYTGFGTYSREVAMLRRKVLGPEHPDTLESMLLLANRTGNPTEAYQLRQEVLGVRRKTLGPEAPATIRAMDYVAFSERDLGHLDEAVKLWEEVRRLSRKGLGPEHPDSLMLLHNLAEGYDRAGRQAEALALREELLPLRRKVLGPEHPDTIIAMEGLGRSYLACGRPAEGCDLLEAARALRQKVLGPTNPLARTLVNDLVRAYVAVGRPEDMQTLVADEIARLRQEGDLVLADYWWRWQQLGHGLVACRKAQYPEADRMLKAAALFGAAAVRVPAEFYYAMSLFQQGQVDEARRLFAEAEACMKPLPADLREPPNGTDRDDVIAWLACREARTLLASPGSSSGIATKPNPGSAVSPSRAEDIRRLFEEELGRLAASLAAAPTNSVLAMRLAALQAWFGRETDYLATCRQMLQWAATEEGIRPADTAAKVVNLRPCPDPQMRQTALALVRRNVALGSANPWLAWAHLGLGMAEYRNGHYPEADRMLSSELVRSGSPSLVLTSKFYGALSLFQQGQVDAARRRLTEAEARMRPLPSDLQWPLTDANHDELIIWLAYKEARALLGPL